MTQIVLPITSRANTDSNLFSDVYSNDSAISTVVNGDLRNDNLAAAGTANIAPGKLSAGSSTQLLVCNASGVPTYRTVTGDVTIGNTGVTAIGASKVVTTMIADANVTSRKLSPSTGSIKDAALNQVISSGTPVDLTGLTVSITPTVASTLLVWASFDFRMGDAAHNLNQGMIGYLAVDGARQATTATLESVVQQNATTSSVATQGNVSCSWAVPLTVAAHTVKLQAAIDLAAGTETATCKQATMTYLLLAS